MTNLSALNLAIKRAKKGKRIKKGVTPARFIRNCSAEDFERMSYIKWMLRKGTQDRYYRKGTK